MLRRWIFEKYRFWRGGQYSKTKLRSWQEFIGTRVWWATRSGLKFLNLVYWFFLYTPGPWYYLGYCNSETANMFLRFWSFKEVCRNPRGRLSPVAYWHLTVSHLVAPTIAPVCESRFCEVQSKLVLNLKSELSCCWKRSWVVLGVCQCNGVFCCWSWSLKVE